MYGCLRIVEVVDDIFLDIVRINLGKIPAITKATASEYRSISDSRKHIRFP